MNALASCFSVFFLPSNPPIGQALAFNRGQGNVRALHVLNPKPGTVIIAEVIFREVAMQMLLAATVLPLALGHIGLPQRSAVRANPAQRPTYRLKLITARSLIDKMRLGQFAYDFNLFECLNLGIVCFAPNRPKSATNRET